MALNSPPIRSVGWRPDRPTLIVAACVTLAATLTGFLQARSAAQIRGEIAGLVADRADLNLRLDALQGVLGRLDRTLPGDGHADAAAASGRRAIEGGRWGDGQFYLINAITNDTKNVEHLKTYTNAVLGQSRPPDESLDQLASILQMAACHVGADDVSTVIGLIDRVGKVRGRPEPGDSVSPTPAPTDDGLAAEWAGLKAGDDAIARDPIRLTAHLRALENFAATLDERGDPDVALTREVADQLRRWNEVAQAARNITYVDQCLAKIADPELARTDNDRAVAIVQAAEAVLPSFWGIPPGALPDELQRKINSYPASIKERVEKIGIKKSEDLMKLVVANLNSPIATDKLPQTQGKTIGPIERNCLEIQEQVKQAQVLAAQLPSPSAILQAQKLIEKRTQALQSGRNEQFSKYQSRVIARCNNAFAAYQTYRAGLSESDAVTVLTDSHLLEVDQSLLNPEVSRLFNDMIGKLMSETNPPKLVEIEGKMSAANKLKLEEF